MGRIVAWTPSLTGGIVVVRDPCLHGRFSIESLCVGPSDTMSWSPTTGLLIAPQETIQPRLGGRVERLPNTFRTEVVDVKARETQVAVVPPRPSPPPPCQSLTRASSWTACAWQGRHMRAWVRARAWSGKARASWARSYRTVGSRSSMRATGGAFSANLPPPPLRVRCPRARHTGWRPHLERAAKTTALRRSSGQSARCPSPS